MTKLNLVPKDENFDRRIAAIREPIEQLLIQLVQHHSFYDVGTAWRHAGQALTANGCDANLARHMAAHMEGAAAEWRAMAAEMPSGEDDGPQGSAS